MSPPDKGPLGVAPGAHLDEEECLPFPIFMAELELLVGNSKRGKPDGVQLLELLQKLVATIPRTDKAVLKQYQRQCEAMLYDVLAHGIGAAVRRLIYNCFSSLYAHGDAISIYTRVNVLQSYLGSKEGMSRSTGEPIRVGLLDFLAHLHLYYGRMLGNSAPDSIGIALRTVSKGGNQPVVRCAALRLATAVLRGMNSVDRSAPTVQADGWTIVQRHVKDRTCEEVRAGCLKLLGALCAAGGGPLWRDGAYGAEEALRTCLALTEDAGQAVRDAAYAALGELAAASRPAAKSEAVTGEKRPAKKAAAERVVSGCVRGCLVQPLLDAALHSKRETCLGISRAWMAYIAAIRHQHHGSDQTTELLEIAALLINAVNEAGRLVAETRTSPGTDPGGELGAGLAGSEQPPLQACALYVLRRGIMSALTEAGQRKLLERLAFALDKRLCTPAAVVTLEALAALLEAVGEVTDETAGSLERLLQPYVTSNSAATRQQAAIAMAALAAAHPAAAARMLSGCLDTVASCAAQMAAPLSAAAAASTAVAAAAPAPPGPIPSASPGGAAGNGSTQADGQGGVPVKGLPSLRTTSAPVADGGGGAAAASVPPSPPRPATPNGGGGRPMPVQRAVMDTCHGAALAAARLLLATARAPLGCPARLQQRALALAEDLASGPGPELAGNRAICREVGFLLLGTLCALGVPQSTRGPGEMAALWQTALGETARKELDERGLPQRPGVDLELAVQLWWRSVALQALAAYLAAAQAGSGSGAAASFSAPSRSRSATALAFLHGASAACFSGKQSEAANGLPRMRSGTGGTGAAGAGAASAGGWEQEWAALVDPLVPLVEPLLELLDSQSYLHEPAKAKGGPGGVLAGAAAMFTLSLLELHLCAPGGRISSSASHAALLTKTCLRPFRQGLTPAAADALTIAGLRGLLSPDDAPLGPWPPGTDPLEDALRSFTGGRGAPQLPPWLSAEDYAALLSGAFGSGSGGGSSAAAVVSVAGVAVPSGLLPAGGDDVGGAAADGSSDGGAAAAAVPGVALGASGGGGGEAAVASSSSSGGLAHAAYPQAVGLEAALLTVQLVMLGRQTAASPVLQQLQVLEVILAAVQASKTFARQSRDAAACCRLPLAVAAAVAALAGYGHAAMAARRSKASLDPSDKVSEKLLQLAQALMPDEEATAPLAAALSRATAETYAASAAAGSETWALRVVRALGSELAASAAEGRADPQQRAVLALALGAAHRCRGGLAMQAAVGSSAEALVAGASRPGCAGAAAWVLHGLWLVACSGGGAFVPRVKTSLQLGQELLVSSFESPALRAACARLANASVLVLGPEFRLGSLEYVRAKSLVAASGGGGGGGGGHHVAGVDGGGGAADGAVRSGGGGGADGGLGLVLFVQQIILFAPHAVPPAKHVLLLLSHLLSSQPDLRAASALTLRHLAERSAEALRPAEAAPLLFAALDRESDARIAGQLRATITTVLNASVVSGPSFWLELLSDVVFAAGPPASAAAGGDAPEGHRSGGGGGGGGDDEDEEDKYGRAARSSSASSGSGAKASGRSGSGKAPRSVREVLTAPHLRTRHYAAECLLRLVHVCVASNERHRDSSVLELFQAAGRPASSSSAGGAAGRAGDLLIIKLQALVDMGFKLATCPLESLRPHGVRMLTLLVQLFGDVPDPLLQGARLMEQYQAQVVSALRSSLGARQAAAGGLPGFASAAAGTSASAAAAETVQHPLLQIAGGALATCFLESGLAAGDALVLRRLMELLSAPLSAWHTLRYEPYAEWVGVRARVELLRAQAQCCAIAAGAAGRGDALCAGIVAKAQEPHAGRLQALWAALLQDHAVLCSQPPAVLELYRSPLLEGSVPPEAAAPAAPPPPPPKDGNGHGGLGEDGGEGEGERVESGFGLTPAVAAVLRPVYAAACPAALAALAGRLPPAAELTAAAAGAGARAQFRRLLEVGLMLLSDAAARLAHAVHEATRGAAAAAAVAATDVSAMAAPPRPTDFPQLRDAAARLSDVLRALQRFFASEYLTALIVAAPAVDAAAPAAPAANGKPGVAAAPAAAEPLVPPAVLRDLLQSLGAAAAHALLPLHWALASAAVPRGLGALLTGLALPCCSLVRELCSSAPEHSLAAAAAAAGEHGDDGLGDGGGSGSDGAEEGDGLRRRSSAAGEAAAGLGAGNGQVEALRDSDDGGRVGSCTSVVTAAAVEAILLLASVCAPYSYGPHLARLTPLDGGSAGSTAGSGGGAAAAAADARESVAGWVRPPFVSCPGSGAGGSRGGSDAGGGAPDGLPGCVPLPSLGAEAAAGLAQCMVQVLAAAQQLIRRAPWSAMAPHTGPLLELPLRLILTSAPGTPVVAAAQRYLETTTAALLARPEARSAASAPQAASAAGSPSPATFAAASIVALSDVTELHLRALRRLDGDGGAAASGGAAAEAAGCAEAPAAAAARLQGRLAALVPALLSCSASFEAAEPPAPQQAAAAAAGGAAGPSPVPSPSKAPFPSALGRTGSGSAGSGAVALHLRSARGALSAGSGGGSRALGSAASVHRASTAGGAAQQQQQQPQVAAAALAAAAAPSPAARLSAAAVRDCVMAAAAGAFQAAVPPAAALAVLEAARAAVQEAAVEEPGSARGRWARAVVHSLMPPAVERVAALLALARQPLAGSEQSLVAECLKLLVLAATLAGPHGAAAQEGVMQVLVPMLVEVAAPAAGPAAATPPLRDLAVKLITTLPAAAAGAAFKAQLAAQPAAAKLRLQGALREAAAAAAATAAAAAAAPAAAAAAAGAGATPGAGAPALVAGAGPGATTGRRPAIQLKTTFALPLPGK
ncbi:hypothetical protein PLESTF_001032900 [Pleodorina starrii]|nr:hypothetical protein PLESTF_001032900 [Pleodorina starrii]